MPLGPPPLVGNLEMMTNCEVASVPVPLVCPPESAPLGMRLSALFDRPRQLHTPDEISRKLHEAGRLQGEGLSIGQICQKLETTAAPRSTFAATTAPGSSPRRCTSHGARCGGTALRRV
jgi:hypothetical protein